VSRWLARVSESDLRRIVRGLLVFIGVLLVIEVVVAWPSPGLPLGDLGRMALGVVAGIVIGAVSSLLGVAGGELIIPTLMFVFGADIRTAGTLSLFISMPSVLVGLASQRAQLVAAGRQDLTRVVVPLAVGSVVPWPEPGMDSQQADPLLERGVSEDLSCSPLCKSEVQ